METKKRRRTENLKPWKPGQSGNPGGRPKKDIASEIAQRVFEENADAIYRAMLKALLKGDPKVFAVPGGPSLREADAEGRDPWY